LVDLVNIAIGIAVVALVLVLALLFRARARPRDVGGGSAHAALSGRAPARHVGLPGAVSTPGTQEVPVSAEASLAITDQRVRHLAATGQKMEAIKEVRAATGWDLKRSKQYVEALPMAPPLTQIRAQSDQIDPELQRHLMSLLQQGKHLEALKVARQHTGLDLKRIKALIDSLGRR
jgi:ribosomal protein L7/L12